MSAASRVIRTTSRWRDPSNIPARAFVLSAVVAVVTLGLVLAVASLSTGLVREIGEGPPFVAGDLADVLAIAGRNGVVLVLVAAAAWLVVRRSVAAVGVLAAVVLVQAVMQGRRLAGVSDFLFVPAPTLTASVLPHAALELTGLLLPLSAAVVTRSRRAVVATAAVGLVIVAGAAAIETYGSPRVYRALACTQVGNGLATDGGCDDPAPCPRLSPDRFERTYGARVSAAAKADYRERCVSAAGPRDRPHGRPTGPRPAR